MRFVVPSSSLVGVLPLACAHTACFSSARSGDVFVAQEGFVGISWTTSGGIGEARARGRDGLPLLPAELAGGAGSWLHDQTGGFFDFFLACWWITSQRAQKELTGLWSLLPLHPQHSCFPHRHTNCSHSCGVGTLTGRSQRTLHPQFDDRATFIPLVLSTSSKVLFQLQSKLKGALPAESGTLSERIRRFSSRCQIRNSQTPQ